MDRHLAQVDRHWIFRSRIQLGGTSVAYFMYSSEPSFKAIALAEYIHLITVSENNRETGEIKEVL